MKTEVPCHHNHGFLRGVREVLVRWGADKCPEVPGEEKANRTARRNAWDLGHLPEVAEGDSLNLWHRDICALCLQRQIHPVRAGRDMAVKTRACLPFTKHFPGAHWKFKCCKFYNFIFAEPAVTFLTDLCTRRKRKWLLHSLTRDAGAFHQRGLRAQSSCSEPDPAPCPLFKGCILP